MSINLKTERESRGNVSNGLLKIYGKEVPLFNLLHETIRDVNERCVTQAETDPKMKLKLAGLNLRQLGNIRHAAIRLALPEEMELFVRIMNHLGQFPVAFYDLTGSGTPVKSTVLRPIHDTEINENAFTIFSSMLDVNAMDFTGDPELEGLVKAALADRREKLYKGEGIASKRLLALLDKAETKSLSKKERREYEGEVIKMFQLNKETLVNKDTYERVKKMAPVAADIIGAGLNINHLTPDTPDIRDVYQRMEKSINPSDNKPVTMNGFIYGPKDINILLEQTSFKAVEVRLKTPDGHEVEHKARFGEVESRGMAVTVTGRAIYDKILKEINAEVNAERNRIKADFKAQDKKYIGEVRDKQERELGKLYEKLASERFPAAFPKTEKDMALQGLVYFNYVVKPDALKKANKAEVSKLLANAGVTNLAFNANESAQQRTVASSAIPAMEALVDAGIVERQWIKYRDFLPASAAGIFSSNRDTDEKVNEAAAKQKAIGEWYHNTIGVINYYDLYEHFQAKALKNVVSKLEKAKVDCQPLKGPVSNALEAAYNRGNTDKLVSNHRSKIIPELIARFKANEKEVLGSPASKASDLNITNNLTSNISR